MPPLSPRPAPHALAPDLPAVPAAASSHAMAMVIASGVAALLLAWFFALRPALDAYRRVHAVSLQELQDRLVQRQASLAKLLAVDQQFSSITAEEQEKLQAVLPNDVGVSDIIANLEALVGLSGLTLNTIGVDSAGALPAAAGPTTPSAAQVPAGVQVITVHIGVEGVNYLTFQQLLHRIETNMRLLDVPAIEFEGQGESLSLSLLTYAYRPPQVVQ